MIVGTMKMTFHAPWVHSLKEKRMIVKSICGKVGSKFNVSIAEVEQQDLWQSIVLGIACVTNETGHADSILDNILHFVESNTDAEIIKIERDVMIVT